jgi:hypothetical protein
LEREFGGNRPDEPTRYVLLPLAELVTGYTV